MGSGIALVAAQAAIDVEVVEPDPAARERAEAYLEREAQRAGDASATRRIRWSEAIGSRIDATIAIEAVPERFELKRDVFLALARALSPEALVATNTSSLSVGELADVDPAPRTRGRSAFLQSAHENGAARDRLRAADQRRRARSRARVCGELGEDGRPRGRHARIHRQPRRPPILPAGVARARARRRIGRRARRARARQRAFAWVRSS